MTIENCDHFKKKGSIVRLTDMINWTDQQNYTLFHVKNWLGLIFVILLNVTDFSKKH